VRVTCAALNAEADTSAHTMANATRDLSARSAPEITLVGGEKRYRSTSFIGWTSA